MFHFRSLHFYFLQQRTSEFDVRPQERQLKKKRTKYQKIEKDFQKILFSSFFLFSITFFKKEELN